MNGTNNRILFGLICLTATALLAGCSTAVNVQPQNNTASEKSESIYDPASFDPRTVFTSPKQETSVDIAGCDTFTQIVDKLEAGKGYANVRIGDTDALLVSDGTYENEPGEITAIDAGIFIYKDDAPSYLATVTAAGTAYPLAVKDDVLYVAGGHFISAYIIDTASFVTLEEGYITFSDDGSETYYYKTCNSQFEDYDENTAKDRFDALRNEMADAEFIEFQPVGGAAANTSSYDDPKNLPVYTYQGTENYVDVISDYMVNEHMEWDTEHVADVYIPYSIVSFTDDRNPDDILVYGVYSIDGYDLLNTTLAMENGSSGYGVFHLGKNDDHTFEVVKADLPESGIESKKLFDSVPGLFEKTVAMEKENAEILRAEAIADYVNTNALNITQWRSYGRAPIPVINAPETDEADEFYTYSDNPDYSLTYDLREFSFLQSDSFDILGVNEADDKWTGTAMEITREEPDAEGLTWEDASIGDGISCQRALYDEPLTDGRIFRNVYYRIPLKDDHLIVNLKTTVEKGVSELTVEELEQIFADVLKSFIVKNTDTAEPTGS